MSGVAVRRFRADDLFAVMEVRKSAICGVASRDYSPEQIAAWAAQSQDIAVQAHRFGEATVTWVAEVDRKVAGFINLGADGYLDCLYVHADSQGRGAANALLDALEVEARKLGAARVHADVSITARPFFECRGFGVVSPQKVIVDGIAFDNFKMEKPL